MEAGVGRVVCPPRDVKSKKQIVYLSITTGIFLDVIT